MTERGERHIRDAKEAAAKLLAEVKEVAVVEEVLEEVVEEIVEEPEEEKPFSEIEALTELILEAEPEPEPEPVEDRNIYLEIINLLDDFLKKLKSLEE